MSTEKQPRSLWKRLSEKLQTISPIEPGSYKARSLSIETQRDNCVKWLSNHSYEERNHEDFGSDIPCHLLKDRDFAIRFEKQFGNKVADELIPLDIRRSSEYLASTTKSKDFLNAVLQHDEKSLQLPLTENTEKLSFENKLHAIERARMFSKDEALDFLMSNPLSDKEQKEALNAMSDKVLTDKDFLVNLQNHGISARNVPSHISDNDDLMRKCLKEEPDFYFVSSQTVRSDKKCFDKAFEKAATFDPDKFLFENKGAKFQIFTSMFKAAEIEVRSNPETYLQNPESFRLISPEYIPENIKNNKEVIESLLKHDADALRFASRELRKDKQFIVNMTDKYQIDVPRDTLISDRRVALNLTKTDSVKLNELPELLQNDKEFVKNVVRLNGAQLEYATKEMQDDREVVLTAAVSNRQSEFWGDNALTHCSERLKNDRQFALDVIQVKPGAVQYLSENLKNDFQIAESALRADPSCALNLGEIMKKDMISNLSKFDREDYEYFFSEGMKEEAAEVVSRGFEGVRAEREKQLIEMALQKVQQEPVQQKIESIRAKKTPEDFMKVIETMPILRALPQQLKSQKEQ